MNHRAQRFALYIVSSALVAACGHAPPSTTPEPVAARDTGVTPPPEAPPLPEIPRVEGPLAIKIVYPSPNQLLTSRDSNFIFGSVGDGRATVTINGSLARVYPNGAFMAWTAVPPSQSASPPSTARYDIFARVGGDSVRSTLTVRVPTPRPVFALTGPLTIDTSTVTARTPGVRLRNDELVRVSLRAPSNATAWLALPYEARPLALAPEGTRGDSNTFATDVRARDL